MDEMRASDVSMRDYYTARAPYYDVVYEKPERQNDIRMLKAWVPRLFAGHHVLEVACGTGYWTQIIAPMAASITATDALSEPLAVAIGRVNGNSVRFAIADAYSLPECLGQFDAAFAGLWLSHVPKQRLAAFFESLHKRLAPGAQVLLMDNSDAQCRDIPVTGRDTDGNTYQHRTLRDGSVHRVLKNFPTQPELEQMIEGIGLNSSYRLLEHFWTFHYQVT